MMSSQFSTDCPRYSRWEVSPRAPREYFDRVAPLPPLAAQLLYNRGLRTADEFEPFLCTDESLCHDPFLLPDMDKAVERIRGAIQTGELICVYGDFDADGVTSTALLCQGLARLGARTVPYIPHRFQEGYGLNSTALRRLRKEGVGLVVTVDCGISAVKEVEDARQRGLDIVVTDHHFPTGVLPPAVALVDPKRADCAYPFRDLAGVGVAYKLLQALFEKMEGGHGSAGRGSRVTGQRATIDSRLATRDSLDLVALGTVADVSPLKGENRYLVKRGLEVLNRTERIGIQEMLSAAGLVPGGIDTESIAFTLGPRINSAGRLEHGLMGYRLLVTSSVDEARKLATRLEQMNVERQRLTNQAVLQAKEQLEGLEDCPVIVVGSPDFHPGVAGIVAGRLTDEYYRPALVVSMGAEFSRGSARSIPEFNIIEALSRCEDLFSHFGGHAQAAGFSLPTDNLERLRERLTGIAASQLSGVDFHPPLAIDAFVRLATLDRGLFDFMERLAPFGAGNPAPVFLSRNLRATDCRTMGDSGQHVRLRLSESHHVWDAIAFRFGHFNGMSEPVDAVYTVEEHTWNGATTMRLNIIDMAPSR